MTVTLRIPAGLLSTVLDDLRRSHPFAYERVGFLFCKFCSTPTGSLLLAYSYNPVKDDQYVDDDSVGAKIDSSAIREAMQQTLTESATSLHVHLHDHGGIPQFSRVDSREMQALMPCFVNLCPERVHGALVLSNDAAIGKVWGTKVNKEGMQVQRITAIGRGVALLGGI
jgi:hypothetical protein